ncbi:Cytochrome c oxidase subunit 2 precursor [Pseudobythopirellula maris]|uniref:Cytochrome c oxidase subunit 2 n=1 Tax=Pseudobythopirellula maris TaxID=2527991 RepID=A0A5C5ZN41_9BACT|nr:cytochrome c oxidase subunit II [Pseudobythopirellula maris]TWT88859.1 Cytochrome c oxidase subunit 2 precursor [Pseudobythopirellula maris]
MIENLLNSANSLTATALPLAGFWFREAASENAGDVDFLFNAILWICVFFFVLIVAMMVVFTARYYARPGHSAEHTAHHNNALEATWSIIPLFIVMWIFGAGYWGYMNLRTPPDSAYEVQVIGKKWNWSFVYPNGYIDANLHVPIDEPVKLVMTSDDVIHSVFIPAFRVKMDVVPGRYSKVWFTANKMAPTDDGSGGEDMGGFDLFCTEYCGQQHSSMLAKVIVHESGTFQDWLVEASNWIDKTPPAVAGERLYKERGCAACHSIDGSTKAGPTWKGIYGTEEPLVSGESVTVDENYIRESILNPNAKVRAGFKPVMPSYQGQLKEREIDAIIWYIKSLSGEQAPDAWPDLPAEGEEGGEGEAPTDGEAAATDV